MVVSMARSSISWANWLVRYMELWSYSFSATLSKAGRFCGGAVRGSTDVQTHCLDVGVNNTAEYREK